MEMRKLNLKYVVLFGLSLLLAIGTAQAQKLELVVQTGHYLDINSITFSPNGKLLVSTSNEIKLWDVATGKELKTLIGHTYVVLSAAFSPDGKTLASCSKNYRTKPEQGEIKLWDVETGRELKTILGHSESVHSVSFSPDGKTLISASSDESIKLWDVATGREIKTLTGHTAQVNSIAFSPDGKIIASGSSDKTIILWNVETGQKIKSLENSDAVYLVKFSRDGSSLVSSSWWNKTAKLWNVASGEQIKSFAMTSATSSLVWADGQTLISTSKDGNVELRDATIEQTIKLITGQTIELSTINPAQGPAVQIALSKDNQTLAYVDNSEKTIKLWNVTTKKRLNSIEQGHSSYILATAFSPDGQTLAVSQYNKEIKLINIKTGNDVITLKGNFAYEGSFAFSPDSKILVSYGEDRETLITWDVKTGQKLKWNELPNDTFPEWIKLLHPSGNVESPPAIYKSIQATADYNKVKIKNLLTGQEAILVTLDESNWVVVAPDGRFDASEGALKLMHYAYGLEVINLEQLKEMYYEPGLLQKLLGFNKEPLRPIVPLKDVKLYPEIIEQKIEPNTTKLTVKLKNRGGGIGKTEVYVNDKLAVADARNEKLKQNPNIALGEIVTLTIDLPASSFVKGRENQIKIITSNFLKEIGKGNIQSRGTEIVYLDTGKEEFQLPTLYAIVGGVSDYTGDNLDLRFAAKDAEDFSNALQLGAKRLFGVEKVHITTLSTNRQKAEEQPTKENFRKAFADIAVRAKPEDILVVYLAGHGVTLGTGTDTYFYLTKEARSAIKTVLETNFQTVAISNSELIDWLTPNEKNPNDIFVKTLKQVIILDTCAAGNFAKEDEWKKDREGLTGDQIRAMEFLKDKAGTFILMGSAANQSAYEANRYNQGLLTYALLEGMKGLALQKATENVDVRILLDYAEKRVPDLAKEMTLEQRPLIKQPSGNTFVIGQMTDSEKKLINLPQPKPLLLRPVLGVLPINNDPWNLIPELRKRLDAESSFEWTQRSGKGEPALIYIDDDSFPGAWRVTGTYKIAGNTATVEAFLINGEKTISLGKITAEREKVLDMLLSAIRVELAKIQ